MTPEETKKYLMIAAMTSCYDVDNDGVDVIPVHLMRRIIKRLIVRGTCINCALCGKQIQSEKELSFDHIVPHSCGGSDYLHNMQPAHRKCNEQKGNNMTPIDMQVSGESSDASPEQILVRKKKRKFNTPKKRNGSRTQPWNIDTFIKSRQM